MITSFDMTVQYSCYISLTYSKNQKKIEKNVNEKREEAFAPY